MEDYADEVALTAARKAADEALKRMHQAAEAGRRWLALHDRADSNKSALDCQKGFRQAVEDWQAAHDDLEAASATIHAIRKRQTRRLRGEDNYP